MSLNGEYSITLASLRYISDTHKDDTFEELIMPKNGKLTEDMLAKFKDADLVMLASSLYHFSFSSQAMDSLNVIGRYLQQNSPQKPVTLFTTSGLMMDNLPHAQARKWAERYGLRYIKGSGIYSADMLNEKYRADVYSWYHSVRALVTAEELKFASPAAARLIYTDETPETAETKACMTDTFGNQDAIIAGMNMMQLAKITGITLAVMTRMKTKM